ncbi:type VI secretion system baseplate subunit TssG [Azospirillum sp. RWY-5-1]|uniref:Type VI secretion system baseplate subunit TssG n=1 Tax=Azospirillum oleiclasticum TaxID=2735135 RepID=A0ABX2TMW1_9PROT|nr:type VI secretion system baseplate subunit TssG [Azospirillum oleiclasticum]NYZ17598.1 type VI secretion system baseplate subunit TssG [Azospirillum oleiclasticum]NYZ24934.1 type VI secretion system baseplate subunit TssG [Azospirillum oleiclasticum]
MAPPRRRSPASVIDRLFRDPRRFEFFQAVRLLEWQAARDQRDLRLEPRKPVGRDHDPRREVVRLATEPSLTFPGNEIATAEAPAGGKPGTLTVTFLGLVGPVGVLPQHYTEHVIRALRQRSRSLRDFLDLFHHRSLSLFYRAWAKYRLPVAYERMPERSNGHAADPVTTAVAAFAGVATPGLQHRLAVEDSTLLHYAGLLSGEVRSATGLQSMLSDFLGRPVAIDTFVGGWLTIAPEGQSRLPTADEPMGQYCRLGFDSVAGERAWDVQGRFRIRVGPLDLPTFAAFMPEGRDMARLRDLVRFAVGPELDFDVEVTLAAASVPQCRLADGADDDTNVGLESRLGWNSWLMHGPSPEDRKDAVFPTRDL